MRTDLLTDKEAQALLRVSRTTLWRLRRSGSLSYVRVGGQLRYHQRDLRKWLNEHSDPHLETLAIELDPCNGTREAAWRDAILTQDWSFRDDPTNSATHTLHPYPAKFPPPLPARLIEVLSKQGETILDPFCGSGTTLVEALRLDRGAVGVDVNPIGVIASKAKTHALNDAARTALLDLVERIHADAERATGWNSLLSQTIPACEPRPAPPIPNIENWFEPIAIREIGLILSRIGELKEAVSIDLARACLSAVLVQVSNQDSETRYATKRRELKLGEVLDRYAKKVTRTLDAHRTWLKLRHNRRCEVMLADARRLEPDRIGTVDAVVTSPPYANAFDYHLYHRHRMFWLGYDPRGVRSLEIGAHLNHQQEVDSVSCYAADIAACMKSLAACIRPGTPAAFVVGDSLFHGEVINNAHLLVEAAKAAGFRCIALSERAIHPIKRSMISPARRARIERIVLLVRRK